MVIKNEARARVGELVAKYQALTLAAGHGINEEATKQGYILPLFNALGWNSEDVNEVSPEETVSNGRVDYAFKLKGVSSFYLEAKPLGTDITEERWARQAITYALHQGVTWAVLCNFSRLMVFNANMSGASAQTALVLNLVAEDYDSDFDRLWLLSKEGLEKDLLEEEARKAGRLPVRVPIEKRLYAQLREWREELWNQIIQYHKERSSSEIDEIIQRLFNRLIFVRTCEDRELEEHQLLGLLNRHRDRQLKGRQPLLQAVRGVFRHYRNVYDSELFEEHMLDETHIDEPTLVSILDGLHRVRGSLADYNFSLITADVLGAVYEQYLGHVSQRAKQRRGLQARMDLGLPQDAEYEIVEKRQRRKEQGIYYTPQWVVDYIVEQTVGRFINEHRDRPDGIHEMKVLDMACGSGSFLIRAYDALLRWESETARIPLEKMSQEYRVPLLRTNIFGVDLDQQAVEIARLNLLLRTLASRELLPPLRENVRQGNSLIAEGEPEKQPFDWDQEFPEIMKAGGFDIVIGNPPYLKEYVDHQPFHDVQNTKLAKYYQGKMDIWYMFACLAIDLLKPGGLHSFIATNNWPTNAGASILRQKILSETQIIEFVDFGEYRVFETAGIQTMVYLVKKTGKPHSGPIRYRRLVRPDITGAEIDDFLNDRVEGDFAVSYDVSLATDTPGKMFTFVPAEDQTLLSRIEQIGGYRLNPREISQGIICPQEFVLPKHFDELEKEDRVSSSGIFILTSDERSELKLSRREREVLKPYYTSEELGRYYGDSNNRLWVVYTSPDITEKIDKLPMIKAHLDKYSQINTSDNRPYGLHRARDEDFFLGEKIISLRKTARPHFTYSDFACYVSQTFFVLKPTDINLKYLVAVLNSKVCHYWLDRKGKKQGNALQIDKAPLLEIPVRLLDLGSPEERRQHDEIVELVEGTLALQRRLWQLQTTHSEERAELERKVAQMELAIDEAVYILYNLTNAEKRLVERALEL